MPNVIDQNGCQIQTVAEIIDEILNGTSDYAGMYQIYGSDINVLPNSPDGQMINIFAQAKRDILEFCQQVFSSMDPDQAMGQVLDERCLYNGVTRAAGTYTKTNITVVTDRAITLSGLDTAPNSPFTVSDSIGNQFALVSTYAFSGAATQVLLFQAVKLGAVQTTVNTITNIVTATLGVLSVNNPTAATVVGTNEESDYSLRIRRAKSVALPSKGYFDGLYGGLVDVAGVTSVNLLENIGPTADANGIPGHSIWAIVAGGSDTDVANVIYRKRNGGCGMKGGVSVNVTQVDASVFTVKFDRPTTQVLYIKFDATAVTGTLDPVFIRNQILALLSYQIGQSADASAITALVKSIAPNVSLANEGVSPDGVTYSALLAPPGVNYQFQIAAARIIINGSHP